MTARCVRAWPWRWAAPLLALLTFAGACEPAPVATEVLVLIDAEPALAAALTRLEVDVFDGRGLDSAQKRLNILLGDGPGSHRMPLSFSIAALDQHDDREFRVLVTGFDATQTPRAEQQVITSFHPNSAGRLDLYLYGGCSDLCRVNGQPGELTCNRGTCEAVPVRTQLPSASADDLGGYTNLGPVAATPDGGSGLPGGDADGASSSPGGGGAPGDAGAPSASEDAGGGASPDTGAASSDAGTGSSDAGRGSSDAATGSSDAGSGSSDAATGSSDAGAGSSDSGTQRDADADAHVDSDADVVGPSYAFDPIIPAPSGACPSLQSGSLTVMGLSLQIYAGPMGPKKGALLFYWHGTGGAASEAMNTLPAAVRAEIMEGGGMIVSGGTSTGTGTDSSGAGVWRTGDLPPMDQITACAVRDYNIDPRRIYSTGCSAGGMHASFMAFARASYLAAVTSNSGGLASASTGALQPGAPRMTPVLSMHGGTSDQVIISFAEASRNFYTQAKALGGYAINCDHGGGHCTAPSALQSAAWQFMKDHPYGVTPKPYPSALPASFPAYCVIK